MDVFYFIVSLHPTPPFLNLFLGSGKKSMLKSPSVLMCEIGGVAHFYDGATVPFDRVNIKRNILENMHLSMKNSLNSGCVHTKWSFYSVEIIKPDPEKMRGAPAIEMWISLIHTSIRKIWNMWKFKSCKAITWLLIHFSNIVTFNWTVKRLFLVFFFFSWAIDQSLTNMLLHIVNLEVSLGYIYLDIIFLFILEHFM